MTAVVHAAVQQGRVQYVAEAGSVAVLPQCDVHGLEQLAVVTEFNFGADGHVVRVVSQRQRRVKQLVHVAFSYAERSDQQNECQKDRQDFFHNDLRNAMI